MLPQIRPIRDASIPHGKQRFEMLHARIADVGTGRAAPAALACNYRGKIRNSKMLVGKEVGRKRPPRAQQFSRRTSSAGTS